MVLAFHGEPQLKHAVMARLREHRRLDQIVQRIYFEGGRGCHLGCITHAPEATHAAAERLFGIEQRIGYWLETVFEGLPAGECAKWVIESTNAIPVGADLSRCHHHFGAWLLGESGLLAITDANRAAIEQVAALHRQAAGQQVPQAAWSAAWSAAELAAWSAADSAARFERLAAWSAADSAARFERSAAESAAWAAESARSAWRKIAAKSIEIFAAAPVAIEQQQIAPDIERDLCCRNLWCRESLVEIA